MPLNPIHNEWYSPYQNWTKKDKPVKPTVAEVADKIFPDIKSSNGRLLADGQYARQAYIEKGGDVGLIPNSSNIQGEINEYYKAIYMNTFRVNTF